MKYLARGNESEHKNDRNQLFFIKIIDQKFQNNEIGKFFHHRKIDHFFYIQNFTADGVIQITDTQKI